MSNDWRFAVMASGIEADKAGSARARYNRASLATQALVDLWRQARSKGVGPPTLGGILAEAGAADELARLAARRSVGDFAADELERRLAHFVAEDGRVPAMLEAFGRADAAALGELSAASQRDAESLLGNQIPETATLARLAREHGAFAATSFGAGFGGSAWALVQASEAETFASRWRTAYRAAVPAVRDVASFVVRPAPPVTELEISES